MKSLLLGLLLMASGQAGGEAVSSPHYTETIPVESVQQPRHLQMWHIDAPVVPVSVAGSELTPPSDPSVIGWWGQPVGSKRGATLLTGHTVHTGGGEFDHLGDVPIGSPATVSGVSYIVRTSVAIDPEIFAAWAPKLLDQTGPHRLVLITCSDWNGQAYDTTTVVVLTRRP